MDREGDNFELFATLIGNNDRFVIRLAHDRRLKKGRGRDGSPMLNEELHRGSARFMRTVEIGRRESDPARNKHTSTRCFLKEMPGPRGSKCAQSRSKSIDRTSTQSTCPTA